MKAKCIFYNLVLNFITAGKFFQWTLIEGTYFKGHDQKL